MLTTVTPKHTSLSLLVDQLAQVNSILLLFRIKYCTILIFHKIALPLIVHVITLFTPCLNRYNLKKSQLDRYQTRNLYLNKIFTS